MKIYPDKICIECKQALAPTLENFYKSESHKDGLNSKCKQCCIEYNKQYQKKKKQERKKRFEKWSAILEKYMENISIKI